MGRRPEDDDIGAPLLVRLARFGWRLDALDKWREDVDRRLGIVEDRLDGLVKVDEVASAVSAQLKRDRTFGFTFVQKCCGAVVAAIVVAGELKSLIG